ncbi:hypothetical protein [Olivibacter domesticus]|uniref:Uncharacterized protein n=1 Tax=Olivibacter domesticus TaxID=407022 RepID=A0A1H7LT72_OLID1|nr:hypothetical protein [Olivibacter domesticus]SEL01665.1 hypothetical protein SAMN05661044_01752 [Olivibacter domesticus]
MLSTQTKILTKTFASSFFKAHAGFLFFLFATLISYCFFIKTLGKVSPEEATFFNLAITLTILSTPIMTVIFFLACIIYTLKSWQYITLQLQSVQNEFLYYSIAAASKSAQLKSWFIVQLRIFLPILIYAIYSVIVGIAYGYYLHSLFVIFFIILLTAASSWFYVHITNKLNHINNISVLIKLVKNWRKPFFTLYTFYVFNQSKIVFLITKISSWLLIMGIFQVFSDLKNDIRVPFLIMLMVIITHTVLIYNEYRFNTNYLSFSYNFPIPKTTLFFGFTINYFLLLLPEIMWFFTHYSSLSALGITLWGFSLVMLLRSFLYRTGLKIKTFIKTIFILFFFLHFVIMYQLVWTILPISLVLSYVTFSRNYYYKTILE